MTEIGISIEQSKDSNKTQSSLLHDAARKYDVNLLKDLLEKGCDPNTKDQNGKSPLHVLLKDGFLGHLNEVRMQECLQILIEYKCDVNGRDGTGECPLSIAVLNNFQSSALLLVRNGADTTVRTPKFKAAHKLATRIAATMPDVMMEILDSGVTLDYDNKGESDQPVVRLDFRKAIQFPTDSDSEKHSKSRKSYNMQRETSFIYSMLDAPPTTRYQYLTHPLIAAYLHLRVTRTKKSLYLFQLVMALYPLVYMIFVFFLYFNRCKFNDDDEEDGKNSTVNQVGGTTSTPKPKQYCDISVGISCAAYLLSTVVVGSGILEIYMLLRVDFKYIKSWRAWVYRASIVTMGFTLWPALQFNALYDITWQYPIAALGTFFAWIMFLIQMELIPKVKIYLEMLAAIITSVVKIILLFLPLFIGFYMGFNLMFFRIDSVMSYIMMSVDVGSDEYEEMIASARDDRGWFTVMADIFSVAFIIIIAIVFLNFLLGASISDIQELKRNAKITSLSHRVQTVFVINLVFPFRFNVVSKKDIKRKNWYYTYVANDEKCHSLTEKIRTKITLLLKSRYYPATDDDAGRILDKNLILNNRCTVCSECIKLYDVKL